MKLSDDATPELVNALPGLEPGLRRQLEFELQNRQSSKSDWRTWNLSRSRAQKALEKLP
jgi:hypothetical protein